MGDTGRAVGGNDAIFEKHFIKNHVTKHHILLLPSLGCAHDLSMTNVKHKIEYFLFLFLGVRWRHHVKILSAYTWGHGMQRRSCHRKKIPKRLTYDYAVSSMSIFKKFHATFWRHFDKRSYMKKTSDFVLKHILLFSNIVDFDSSYFL